MISLALWFCLWSSSFVLAPPLLNSTHRRYLDNITPITSNSSIKQRKTINNHPQFDINSYRSSWKFVDKNTIRVRFHLHESLLFSIVSTRFLVHHIHTGLIQIYNEPHEIINSTLTLYLHKIKHGRHTVCLLIYRSKLMKTPKHIFCQDIIFNFHKYGHHDMDSDEYRNTFFFLLTQYAIVLGILCILQLVHATRKRRFLRTMCDKANSLRNLMMEYHQRSQENKSTTDLNRRTPALEHLIHSLDLKNALYNFDQMYMYTTNEEDDLPISDHRRIRYEKHSTTSLLGHHPSISTITNEDLDFDTQSYEEQSIRLKSSLETNKPWMTRLTDNGSIKHAILSTAPLQNTRILAL